MKGGEQSIIDPSTAGSIIALMENHNTTPSKIWLLLGVSTFGMLVFATLYFFNPKTVNVVQTVPNNVTNVVVNTVTNEVVKEVEKIVKVPAAIPEEYIRAKYTVSNFDNADPIIYGQLLFGMKDVQVIYTLSDIVKKVVSEDEVKSKFELTLRRNNITISPNSSNQVVVNVAGFWGVPPISEAILTHDISVDVCEYQTLRRGEQIHKAFISVWHRNFYGFVGRDNANKYLLENVEKQAEIFANDFLSANPKPQ